MTARDPLLDAIARNPRPLIMMLVGLIGMPLSLWLFTPDRAAPPAAPQPSAAANVVQEAVAAAPVSPEPVPVANSQASVDAAVAPDLASDPAPEAVPTLATDLTSLPAAPDPALTLVPAPVAELPAVVLPATKTRYIALIIDDIGYADELGARAVALPDDVTFAVLPHTPFGTTLAEVAHRNGKEVMLHAPMSNLANMPLGPGGLTPLQSREEFVSTLTQALDAVPYLKGLNNHMGSELTTLEAPMRWVMETLQGRDLYFVDSYTNAASVAGRIARESSIPTLTRNVFLDNVQTQEAIDLEFQRLLQLAQEKGFATAIGHPYEATLEYLEKALPTLAQLNIELIPVSQMIRLQQDATDAL